MQFFFFTYGMSNVTVYSSNLYDYDALTLHKIKVIMNFNILDQNQNRQK